MPDTTLTQIELLAADGSGGYSGTQLRTAPVVSIGSGWGRADFSPPEPVTPGDPIYIQHRGSSSFGTGNPYEPGCHVDSVNQEAITVGTFSFGFIGYDLIFKTYYTVSGGGTEVPAYSNLSLLVTALLLAVASILFLGRRSA